jgi:hypothetical protein
MLESVSSITQPLGGVAGSRRLRVRFDAIHRVGVDETVLSVNPCEVPFARIHNQAGLRTLLAAA